MGKNLTPPPPINAVIAVFAHFCTQFLNMILCLITFEPSLMADAEFHSKDPKLLNDVLEFYNSAKNTSLEHKYQFRNLMQKKEIILLKFVTGPCSGFSGTVLIIILSDPGFLEACEPDVPTMR
jgi:hypothetical protein